MSDLITVRGRASDFGMGDTLLAYTRTRRGVSFTDGATVPVNSKGRFVWTRAVAKRKTLRVYFADGDINSNVLRFDP